MTYTTNMRKLSRFIVDRIEGAKADLGIEDVYYGDQRRIPRVPAVCVEPGVKRNELNGIPRRVLVTTQIFILVYHSRIDPNTQAITEETDELAEQLETFIHSDPFFRDIAVPPEDPNFLDQVVQSLVTEVESGISQKGSTLLRSSRLTVETTVQAQLPDGGM